MSNNRGYVHKSGVPAKLQKGNEDHLHRRKTRITQLVGAEPKIKSGIRRLVHIPGQKEYIYYLCLILIALKTNAGGRLLYGTYKKVWLV